MAFFVFFNLSNFSGRKTEGVFFTCFVPLSKISVHSQSEWERAPAKLLKLKTRNKERDRKPTSSMSWSGLVWSRWCSNTYGAPERAVNPCGWLNIMCLLPIGLADWTVWSCPLDDPDGLTANGLLGFCFVLFESPPAGTLEERSLSRPLN